MKISLERNAKPNHFFTLIIGNGLIIDPQTRQVFLKEKELKLTKKSLIYFFVLSVIQGRFLAGNNYTIMYGKKKLYTMLMMWLKLI